METEITTWSEFPYGVKAILEQIIASEERKKSKTAGLWESQSGIRVGKLTIWVEQSSPDLSILLEYVSQSLWWTLKSPKTNTLADGFIERTLSLLNGIESKTVLEDEEGDR